MQRETIYLTGEGKLRNSPRPRSKQVARLEAVASALAAFVLPLLLAYLWA